MTDDVQMPPPADAPPQDAGLRANDQIRDLIMKIGQLAQGIPEAQPEFQAAAKALTAASIKLVAGQREPSPEQPVIGA